MRIGLVILTYNGHLFTKKLAESIDGQERLPDDIVWVDNGSQDGTETFLESRAAKGDKIVLLGKNMGCAAGYNVGARECLDVDVICFLNQDLELDSHYLKSMMRAFAGADVLAVQPLVWRHGRSGLVENCGHTVDRLLTTVPILHDEAFDRHSVPVGMMFTLTAPAMRRDVFCLLGGFDEELFIYYEDTDLSLRIWRLGDGRIVFAPDAQVFHHQEASSMAMLSSEKSYLWARNRLRLLIKHASSTVGMLRVCVAMTGLLLASFVLTLQGESAGAALRKGIWWNLRNWTSNVQAWRVVNSTAQLTLEQLARQGIVQPSRLEWSGLVSRARLLFRRDPRLWRHVPRTEVTAARGDER